MIFYFDLLACARARSLTPSTIADLSSLVQYAAAFARSLHFLVLAMICLGFNVKVEVVGTTDIASVVELDGDMEVTTTILMLLLANHQLIDAKSLQLLLDLIGGLCFWHRTLWICQKKPLAVESEVGSQFGYFWT